MGFPKQEYWSGLSFPSPGDLPDPGTEPGSPVLQADALLSEPPGKPSGLCCAMFSRSVVSESVGLSSPRAPLYMGFSRSEYWSGLPCPPPGDLPHPGSEPGSPVSQADSLPSEL